MGLLSNLDKAMSSISLFRDSVRDANTQMESFRATNVEGTARIAALSSSIKDNFVPALNDTNNSLTTLDSTIANVHGKLNGLVKTITEE